MRAVKIAPMTNAHSSPTQSSGNDFARDDVALIEHFLACQKKYDGETIVFKFGGALAEDTAIVREIARQIALLSHGPKGPRLIGVHGGGKSIDAALAKENIEIRKDPKTGLRITDPATMDICDKTLRALNGDLVRIFNSVSDTIAACGMAAYDGRLASGAPLDAQNDNFTGRVTDVNTAFLNAVLNKGGETKTVPLLYSIGHCTQASKSGYRINFNADDLATAVAIETEARRMVLLSDIPGILDKDKKIIPQLETGEITKLIQDGTISGGMIAKAEAARDAALALGENGGVVILDGRQPGTILKEILGMGGGTLIRTPRPAR